MNDTYYVKSFSKGQITIPKVIRKKMGIGDDFWLKIKVDSNNKIEAEPVSEPTKMSKAAHLEYLSNMDTSWFDYEDYKKMRKEWDDRAKKYGY